MKMTIAKIFFQWFLIGVFYIVAQTKNIVGIDPTDFLLLVIIYSMLAKELRSR